MALMIGKEVEAEEGGSGEEREREENDGRRENLEVEAPWRKGVESEELGLDDERESGGLRRENARDIFLEQRIV